MGVKDGGTLDALFVADGDESGDSPKVMKTSSFLFSSLFSDELEPSSDDARPRCQMFLLLLWASICGTDWWKLGDG